MNNASNVLMLYNSMIFAGANSINAAAAVNVRIWKSIGNTATTGAITDLIEPLTVDAELTIETF